jgi:type I restriction enzyme S subunit
MIRPEMLCPSWSQKPLGEVVEFLDHLRRPITAIDRVSGPYPYYGANGQQDSVADYIFDEPLILMAEDGGYFGDPDRTIAYRIDGKCWVNNHAHVLRPKDDVDIGFLCRQLEKYDVTRFINGATRQKLNKSSASEIPITLPPLAEQKRIAEILDKADAIRRKRRQAIKLADEFLRSVFLDMFGDLIKNTKDWKLSRFGDICESRLGKMLDSKQQTGENQRKYLRNANVQWDQFYLNNLLEMDFKEKDRDTFRLKHGDLLLCEGGEIGRAAIWRNEISECYFQKALHRVRPSNKLATAEYLLHLMWFFARNGGFKNHATSATIAHLTGVKLKEMVIPLPPIELQKKFSNYYFSAKSLQFKYSHLINDSQNLFNSISQRAFRGEL